MPKTYILPLDHMVLRPVLFLKHYIDYHKNALDSITKLLDNVNTI